jgi:hypothetical protein
MNTRRDVLRLGRLMCERSLTFRTGISIPFGAMPQVIGAESPIRWRELGEANLTAHRAAEPRSKEDGQTV